MTWEVTDEPTLSSLLPYSPHNYFFVAEYANLAHIHITIDVLEQRSI